MTDQEWKRKIGTLLAKNAAEMSVAYRAYRERMDGIEDDYHKAVQELLRERDD